MQLGAGCVIAAQTGIAGSTTLGSNVHVGGQVGIAQHLRISDNVRIAAKSGVMTDLAANATYGTFSYRPLSLGDTPILTERAAPGLPVCQ